MSVADDGNDKLVTLLHKRAEEISGSEKTEAAVRAEIDAILPSFNINGITGWRIPTRADLNDFNFNIFNTAISSVSDAISIGTTSYYYYLDGEHLKCFRGNNLNLGYATGDHFRPVTTVRFSK